MIVAEFAHEAAMRAALDAARPMAEVETYTPAPPDDDEASPLPLVILIGGLVTAAASFALQALSLTLAYRFDIGGRPQIAWPSFIPTAFENGVLGAIGCGFIGYFFITGLPKLYDPVDDTGVMQEAMRDRWILRLDGVEDAGAARRLLHAHGALRIEEWPA